MVREVMEDWIYPDIEPGIYAIASTVAIDYAQAMKEAKTAERQAWLSDRAIKHQTSKEELEFSLIKAIPFVPEADKASLGWFVVGDRAPPEAKDWLKAERQG